VVANRANITVRRRLFRIVRSHKVTLNAYSRYRNQRVKRELRSRISTINPDEYFDISHKPNLNIILIAVDCLRNSHLSCQGYFRETTPFLDSLKSRFSAISASSWTYPSVASILTGLYPHNHSAVIAGRKKNIRKPGGLQELGKDIITLPEMLFLLGYRIYFGTAIPPAYWAVKSRAIPREYTPSARADHLLGDLTKWIAGKKGEVFFTYVHLADLHVPLNPPDSFRNCFGTVKPLPGIDTWDFATARQRENDSEKFRDYKENRVLLYDNIVRSVDHAIERLYNSLRDMGLDDSTILIVTADHGEEFWEHAELQEGNFYHQRGMSGVSHGQAGFRELIEVPLLISGPVPDRKHDHFVSAVDIVPTVLDLLGINHKMRFDGRNIFEAGDDRPLLSEASGSGYEKKTLVVGRYKLIYSKDDGIEWVFDLEKDPQEQNPIVDKKVTSTFVDKLLHMLKEDEKRNIREIARKKDLSKSSSIQCDKAEC
jgi:arylsulfatase A-like enzyme